MSTASPFIAGLGTFTTYAAQYGTPLLMFGESLVNYAIAQNFFNGDITPAMFMYLGIASVLSVCLLSAGYLVVKATASAISFIDGFAYFYRLKSTQGNQMGLYETIFVSLYFATSLFTTIASIYGASNLWTLIETREASVKADGFYGSAVSMLDAMKFGMLGMVVAMGTWIAAYSLGNTVDENIGWFDQWSDDASREGRDKEDGDVDADGTAVAEDFFYHAITVVYSWLTFTAIMVGGQYFFYTYGKFTTPDCDLSAVDKSYYSGVPAQIQTIVSLDTCKSVRKSLFMLADKNKDNTISRCENAMFLYGLGNEEKYAL